MTIPENLRNLRLAAGLTQEQAALQLGLTRQGLSSYETGRTHPDLEMLQKLATLYHTDLDGILYGQSKTLRARRTLKRTAAALYIVLASLTFISSAFLGTANRFFRMPSGEITEASEKIFEVRKQLTAAWEFTDGLILAVALIGLLFLLIFSACTNCRYSLKYRLAWAAACAVTVWLIAFCFGAADQVFPAVNYLITPLFLTARIAIFTILDILIQIIQNRKRKNKV